MVFSSMLSSRSPILTKLPHLSPLRDPPIVDPGLTCSLRVRLIGHRTHTAQARLVDPPLPRRVPLGLGALFGGRRGRPGLVPDLCEADFRVEKRMCFLFALLGHTHNSDDDADHGGRRGKEEENEDRFWRRHAASNFLCRFKIWPLIECKTILCNYEIFCPKSLHKTNNVMKFFLQLLNAEISKIQDMLLISLFYTSYPIK